MIANVVIGSAIVVLGLSGLRFVRKAMVKVQKLHMIQKNNDSNQVNSTSAFQPVITNPALPDNPTFDPYEANGNIDQPSDWEEDEEDTVLNFVEDEAYPSYSTEDRYA